MEALIIISNIIAIIVSALICDSKGRTVWKGIVAGAFLGWIGVIVCACLDNHKK